MAIFMDTGGGDIYAGPTKAACIEAMLQDNADCEVQDAFEVSGDTKMQATDENDEPMEELTALNDEYVEEIGSYCIASENC